MMDSLADIIETAYEHRSEISPTTVDKKTKEAILQAIALLDSGQARVAEPVNGQWQVNQWLKKAVLLYFGIAQNSHFQDGMTQYYDKVPLKFAQLSPEELKSTGVRIVPPACVRQGAFIAANTVLMPSYVNIGAFIDEGTLIDTWATVGSCVQVGKHVHISGGAGLGGVLEPVQANPTIIEDNCFIGARSEIVEGVIVERNSVISMGVFIGQSTKIYHRETGEISYGRVPAGSVVVPGNLPAKDGSHSLYCAVIVKQVDEKTRHKVAINDLLRDIN